jgi:hypothetical protein
MAEYLVVRAFVIEEVGSRGQRGRRVAPIGTGQAQGRDLRHGGADAEHGRFETEQGGDLVLEAFDQGAGAIHVVFNAMLRAPGCHGGVHLGGRAGAVAGEDSVAAADQFGVGQDGLRDRAVTLHSGRGGGNRASLTPARLRAASGNFVRTPAVYSSVLSVSLFALYHRHNRSTCQLFQGEYLAAHGCR